MAHDITIQATLPRTAMGGFLALLGQGVGIDVPLGISVLELLGTHLDYGEDYVQDRIQTIFVNGKAVDREQDVLVTEGAVIALSAAMPGLVGATLRKGGQLAAMRSTISQAPAPTAVVPHEGRITLKLFNMIAREKGFDLLARGVWISGVQLADTLAVLKTFGMDTAGSLLWNAASWQPTALAARIRQEDMVRLRVDWVADTTAGALP